MPLSRLNRFKRTSFNKLPFEEGLTFPKGLHGFENLTLFSLTGHAKEAPYLRLVSKESEAISFIVTDPFPIYPGYEPLITTTDLNDIHVWDGANLIILTIVNVKERPFTMNLGAPLLIYWQKRLGKQLLFPEDPAFSID